MYLTYHFPMKSFLTRNMCVCVCIYIYIYFFFIQTFKQLDKKGIEVIYTSHDSCGINLINGEYLLSGKIIYSLEAEFESKLNTLIPDAGC